MDSSESNADSLEHESDIEPLQKDLSPTIFELDPDSLSHSTKPNQENMESQTSKCREWQQSDLSVTPNNSMTQVIDGESNCPIAIETNLDTTGELMVTRDEDLALVTESQSSPLVKKTVSRMNMSPFWVVDTSTPLHSEKNNTSLMIQPTVANSLVKRHVKLFDESVSRISLDSDSSERSSKKSMGFYVDLSSMPDVAVEKETQENLTEKKNIFSMYIELGDNSNVKVMPKKLSSSLNNKNMLGTSSKSPLTSRNTTLVKNIVDSINSLSVEVTPDVQCEETIPKSLCKNELPIIPSIDLRRKKDNFEIWNTTGSADDGPQQLTISQKCTQSDNLESLDMNIAKTNDKDCVSGISPIDDYTYSKSEISSFSSSSHSKQQSESYSLPPVADEHLHCYKEAGAVITDGNDNVTFHENRPQHMNEPNESFCNGGTCSNANDFPKDINESTIAHKNYMTCQYDLESLHGHPKLSRRQNEEDGSLSQLLVAIESNDLSSTAVFVEVEKLCNTMTDEKVDSSCSILDIVSLMKDRELKKRQCRTSKTEVETKMENLQAAIVKQKKILAASEKAEHEQQKRDDAFVRLSDLDKALPMISSDSAREHISCDRRMTKSIPEPSNKDKKKYTMSRSTDIFSSFHSENAGSLSRLFPQLKKEFGRSSSNTTDISITETSQSSCVSNVAPDCQKRLGYDLLHMFLKEIAADVIVEVDGRRVKAHTCILASRCPYFAAILSGGWVQSAGNVIPIIGFSYNVVHFALRHIYSGVSTIPESIDITELSMLAEQLGMEGLKEVIVLKLRDSYCHMFHYPCSVCSVGVLDCLPLTVAYGLDEHYLECIRWITKYFVHIWPTRKFAELPKQLIEKCYQEQVVNMTVNNVLATISGCGRVLSDVSKKSWGDSVRRNCHQLMSTATQFISSNLSQVLQTSVQGAISGDVSVWVGLEAIEDCLMSAFELTSAEQMCLTYQWLVNLETQRATLTQLASSNEFYANSITPELNLDLVPGTELEWRLVERWMRQCEEEMLRNILIVSQSKAWLRLDADLQRHLKTTSGFDFVGSSPRQLKKRTETNICPNRSSPRPSTSTGICRSMQKKKRVEDHSDKNCCLERIRTAFTLQQGIVNKKESKILVRVKGPTKSLPRPKTVPGPIVQQPKKQTTRVDETKMSNIQKSFRCKSKKYENVLPRYLEPKPNRETLAPNATVNVCKPNQTKKHVLSGESSRNRTPGLALRSKAESKKCLKGYDANTQEAPKEKSSSESSTVHSSTVHSSTGTLAPQNGTSRLKVVNNNLKTANVLKKTDVASIRMSRPKTRSTSTNKVNPRSIDDLSSINLVPATLHLQRGLSVPLSPKPHRNKLINSPSPNQNIRKMANKSTKPTRSETLMKPTKSSSAKIVVKNPLPNQNLPQGQFDKISNISEEVNGAINQDKSPSNIPVMERSGTFLIEED